MKATIQLQKVPKAAAAVHVTTYVQLYLTVGWRLTNIIITVLTTFGANYMYYLYLCSLPPSISYHETIEVQCM